MKRTVIKLDGYPMSNISLRFMKAIEETQNEEIFKTEIIKMFIDK